MNEFKVIFDEENNRVTFTTNIRDHIIDAHYLLSELADEEFQHICYLRAKLIFDEYKKRILDED